MDLAERIYRVSAAFPRHEMFGLVSQLRRAVVSIPSNIAEGSARKSTKEFIHFLHITRGSLAELETQLQLAQRIGYLAVVELDEAPRSIEEVGRMLNAVVAGLNRRLGQPPPTNP
jgi:four helix bundle protein